MLGLFAKFNLWRLLLRAAHSWVLVAPRWKVQALFARSEILDCPLAITVVLAAKKSFYRAVYWQSWLLRIQRIGKIVKLFREWICLDLILSLIPCLVLFTRHGAIGSVIVQL